jgi:hypothetical protein
MTKMSFLIKNALGEIRGNDFLGAFFRVLFKKDVLKNIAPSGNARGDGTILRQLLNPGWN